MARWFRFYDDVMDDPKVQLLSDAHYRGWSTLLCIASKNAGDISGDEMVLSFALRKPVGKVRQLLQVLLSAQLIDQTETGYIPHNWKGRQYESDSAAERMRRHRAKAKAEHSTSPLRPPLRNSDAIEADTEQNRTEQKDSSPAQALVTKPVRKVTSTIPENFPTADDMQAACAFWAERDRVDLVNLVQDETQAFRAHHTSHGKRMADWGQAWVTWYANAVKFNRKPPNGRDRPSQHENFAAGALLAAREIQ